MEVEAVTMGDLWNILIPVVVIGAIFLNTISENKKKTARKVAPKREESPKPADDSGLDDFLRALGLEPEVRESAVAPKVVLQPAKPRESVKPAFIEGERAIKPEPETTPKKAKKNPVVHKVETSETSENTDVADAVSDLRRAVIAHEILKRKF